MRLILFSLFYFLTVKVHACDKMNIVCKVVCMHDGDQRGVVIDSKCYCANQRDVNQFFVRVPKNGRAVITEKKVSIWE